MSIEDFKKIHCYTCSMINCEQTPEVIEKCYLYQHKEHPEWDACYNSNTPSDNYITKVYSILKRHFNYVPLNIGIQVATDLFNEVTERGIK